MRSIFFERSIPRVLGTIALKQLWKDAIYAPTSPVRMADLPTPRLPGPRGARVANRMSAICASDLHILFVDVDPMVHPAAVPGYQRIYLGHEVVGEVTEVGESVRSLAVGDRVLMETRFTNPTCLSQEIDPPCRHCVEGNYCLCENRGAGRGELGVGGGWGDGYTCHESEVWKIPASLSDEQAVLIEPLACGVRGVLRHRPRAGDKVLVIGCGMIGLATIQALRALCPDAEVYAVARHPHQKTRAREYGAILLEDPDLYRAVESAIGGKVYRGDLGNRTMLGGADVVFDCVASETTLNQALRATRAGGTVVIVGVNLRKMKVDLTPVWHQEVNLIGTMAHGIEHWEDETLSTFDLTARLIDEGKLATDGLITHRFPLERWKEAVQTSVDKRSGAIRVLFEY